MCSTHLDPEKIWKLYVHSKQTYSELATEFGCCVKTIQRQIDKYNPVFVRPIPRKVVVLIDTTYFGRVFGIMLFKDAYSKENLLKYFVKNETNALYIQGINELKKEGFEIMGIVCDGRRGLVNAFENIPVQMCQFHQSAIIRRYLTKKPKHLSGQELLQVIDLLKYAEKDTFINKLKEWQSKWQSYLNERSINEFSKRSFYTHKRLRSAFNSINNNLPWLFVYKENIILKIPNTTNAIDGHFANLKTKLRNHNGLNLMRKMKFITEFFKV